MGYTKSENTPLQGLRIAAFIRHKIRGKKNAKIE